MIEGRIITELVIDRRGKVGSRQAVLAAAAVVSEDETGGRELGRSYWIAVERSTCGLVREVRGPAGGSDLRFLGRGPALVRLGPPRVRAGSGRVSCRYSILGGALARGACGAVTFDQWLDGRALVSCSVTGFYPRLGGRAGQPPWRGALYVQLQARLHHLIGRRWLLQLTGTAP